MAEEHNDYLEVACPYCKKSKWIFNSIDEAIPFITKKQNCKCPECNGWVGAYLGLRAELFFKEDGLYS